MLPITPYTSMNHHQSVTPRLNIAWGYTWMVDLFSCQLTWGSIELSLRVYIAQMRYEEERNSDQSEVNTKKDEVKESVLNREKVEV